MINKEWFADNSFNWKDLDGTTLKISVGQSVDDLAKEMLTSVIGYDESSGHYYVIHTEAKRI